MKTKKIERPVSNGLSVLFDDANNTAVEPATKRTYTSFEDLFNDLYGGEAA